MLQWTNEYEFKKKNTMIHPFIHHPTIQSEPGEALPLVCDHVAKLFHPWFFLSRVFRVWAFLHLFWFVGLVAGGWSCSHFVCHWPLWDLIGEKEMYWLGGKVLWIFIIYFSSVIFSLCSVFISHSWSCRCTGCGLGFTFSPVAALFPYVCCLDAVRPLDCL